MPTTPSSKVTPDAMPRMTSVNEVCRRAIELYARSPDKVRRLIVAQCAPGVTAFADAFRLRKD